MDRQADGAGLVHDGPFDGLANPPRRVGGEAETPFRIELLHRPDQPQVALLDQVEQGQAAVDIAPGDLHHQAQVAFDHAPTPSRIAPLREPREVDLLLGSQQWGKTDFVEVELGGIQRPAVIDVLVLLR